jgi:hypothetical protein
VRFDYLGNAQINNGNLVIGTSGKGIDFSATPGTGTSELLADYEEGTFTPVLTGSTSGTFNGSGVYTKTGRMVFVSMQFINITTANKPIGDYTITGLPFTALATTPDSIPFNTALVRVTFDAAKIFNATLAQNSTTISLTEVLTNNVPVAVTDANFVNASNMFFRVSGTYQV